MRHLALQSDGNIDQLSGLDAPEIFYRFLEKALASQSRSSLGYTAVVRFRLFICNDDGEAVDNAAAHDSEIDLVSSAESIESSIDVESAFAVALFARFLTKATRSDENLTRIGEMTFLLLAHLRDESEMTLLLRRLNASLAQVDLNQEIFRFSVDIEGFTHQQGEEMLEFLERIGV